MNQVYKHSGSIAGILISFGVILVCYFYLNLNEGLMYIVSGLCTIPVILFTDDIVMRNKRDYDLEANIERSLNELYLD